MKRVVKYWISSEFKDKMTTKESSTLKISFIDEGKITDAGKF
jgi:hypothetical protein